MCRKNNLNLGGVSNSQYIAQSLKTDEKNPPYIPELPTCTDEPEDLMPKSHEEV